MRTGRSKALASILAVALVTFGGVAFADNNPVDEQWWPTEFGPDDEAGATNYITPEKRLAAVQLVKQGKVLTLGMPYSNHMPLVPGRTFALSIPGGPTHGPLNWPGDNFLGASKAGTTSLYHYLSEHPDVFMSEPKEPPFFRLEYERGSDYYWQTYFRGYRGEQQIGNAAPPIRNVGRGIGKPLSGAQSINVGRFSEVRLTRFPDAAGAASMQHR
jgi:hypothetical protein